MLAAPSTIFKIILTFFKIYVYQLIFIYQFFEGMTLRLIVLIGHCLFQVAKIQSVLQFYSSTH